MSTEKTSLQSSKRIQLIALALIVFATAFICFGINIILTYPLLEGADIKFVDSSIFQRETAILTAFCLFIPAVGCLFSAAILWLWQGRSPLQKDIVSISNQLTATQQQIFQNYVDDVEFLLGQTRSKSIYEEIERKSLFTLQIIDGSLKRRLVEFLLDLKLLGPNAKIQLISADLSHADLHELDLKGIILLDANLEGAILAATKLTTEQIARLQLSPKQLQELIKNG